MAEIALAVPFEASEIKEIVLAELKKRLDGIGPLQQNREYASFRIEFQVGIKLWRVGETCEPKETLAWGNVGDPSAADLDAVAEEMAIKDSYESLDPNRERVDRDMPLTVESGDGKGGRVTKKVRVKR